MGAPLMKRYVIDLFCGEGGATVGYMEAGYTCVGVENISDRAKRYEKTGSKVYDGDFIEGFEYWRDKLGDENIAFVHASPPCQTFSTATPDYARVRYTDYMSITRQLLEKSGIPFVIENVPRAFKMCGWEPTIILNGRMFADLWAEWDFWNQPATLMPFKGRLVNGKVMTQRQAIEQITDSDGNYFEEEWKKSRAYSKKARPMVDGQRWGVLRPRAFLASFHIDSLECVRDDNVYAVTVTTSPNATCTWNQLNRTTLKPESASAIMAGQKFKGKLDHMSMDGVGEAIPPDYALHIAQSFKKWEKFK
jgi:hypothetical protein